MKKIIKRALSTIMVVLMLLTSAPLQGFVELEWPEIDFSGVGDWFSSKASAADEKLTAEEAVDIFMANKSMWMIPNKYYSYSSSWGGLYTFIDLDFDGVLELATSFCSGMGFFSRNKFYRINLNDNTVYSLSMNYDCEYGLDFERGIKLYKDSIGQKYYLSYDYTRNGTWENGTTEEKFYLDKNMVYRVPLFLEKYSKNYSTGVESYSYYVISNSGSSVNQVSYSNYLSSRNRTYSEYSKDLNLKNGVISSFKFDNSIVSTQRSLLLESYKAFDYDGRVELTADAEYEVYLGYPLSNYINEKNNVHIIYKGDIKEFDVSKVKFTVADKSIAEIKNIKTTTRLKEIDIYGDVLSKRTGETTVTVKYDNASVNFKLIVKQPNELKLELTEPKTFYYEADGVFFDEKDYLSEDGIQILFNYSNVFKEGLYYSIYEPDVLKELKIKKGKIVFEIEEGAGLSFESINTVKTKEIEIENLDLHEKIEDEIKVYCTDSNALGQYEGVDAKIKYTATIQEKDEYVEKTTGNITFRVESYKMHYIKEHLNAMNTGGRYRRMYDYSVAEDMKDLEHSKDFKFVEFLNDGFVKAIADACGTIDEQQAYQLLVADLVCIMSGTEEEIKKDLVDEYSEGLLNCCSEIFNVFVEYADQNHFGTESYRKIIEGLSPEAILNHITGITPSSTIDDLLEEVWASSKYFENAIAKSIGSLEKVGEICEIGGFVLGVATDFVDVLNVYNSYELVENKLKEQKFILEDLKNSAEFRGDTALANALEDFINFEDEGVSKKTIMKSCINSLADDAVDGVISFAGDFIANFTKEKIKNFTMNEIFSAAGTTLTSYLAGVELGGFVSNLLCNSGSYGDACMRVVLIGHISSSLKGTIAEYLSDMIHYMGDNLDRSYDCAKKLDYALNMFKTLEIETCKSTIDALNARDKSITNAIVKLISEEKGKKYSEAVADMTAIMNDIKNAKCHDTDLEKIYAQVTKCYDLEQGDSIKELGNEYFPLKTLCVQCPVDVFVKDSKGNIVAVVENNIVTKETDGIEIVVIEDEKFICLPSTEEYDVEILATDEGTMDYTVFEYDKESVDNVRSVSYEKIPLVKNKEFTAKLDTEKFTDKDNYNLSTGSQTITATSDDYVPVTAISLGADANVVYEGNEITLSVATTPENASPETYKWTSSDESVATVSGGVVKGVKAGKATITCEVKNNSKIKASFEVTITECSHSYSAWEIVEEATCNEYGYKKRSCSICNVVETEEVTDLKAHEPESESYELPATCTKNAATVTLCKNCGEICSRVEKAGTATDHKLGAVTVDKKATTEHSGSQSQKCSNCGGKLNVTKIPRVIAPKISSDVYTFDGKSKTPRVNIYDYDGNKLAEGTDYTLKYSSGRTYPGSYKVKITYIGKYEGTQTIDFKIEMKDTAVKSAIQSTSAIKLTWSAVPGATGYRVYQYSPSKGKYVVIASIKGKTTYTKSKNLKAGSQYKFKIKPYVKLSDGTVIWGSASDAFTTATKPLAPTKVTATTTKSTITLNWSKSAGATGYRVYQYSPSKGKYVVIASVKGTTSYKKSKNLKANTTYKFKIKPYVKLSDGTVIWGSASSAFAFKTKTK